MAPSQRTRCITMVAFPLCEIIIVSRRWARNKNRRICRVVIFVVASSVCNFSPIPTSLCYFFVYIVVVCDSWFVCCFCTFLVVLILFVCFCMFWVVALVVMNKESLENLGKKQLEGEHMCCRMRKENLRLLPSQKIS